MKNKYIDLIDQTFDFPQDEFRTEDGELYFHDIPLMEVISSARAVSRRASPMTVHTCRQVPSLM